jgi:hypothetical protein
MKFVSIRIRDTMVARWKNSCWIGFMSKASEVCLYCDGEGNGPGVPCGFCEEGKPLDTQEDWDATWGHIDKAIDKFLGKKDNER